DSTRCSRPCASTTYHLARARCFWPWAASRKQRLFVVCSPKPPLNLADGFSSGFVSLLLAESGRRALQTRALARKVQYELKSFGAAHCRQARPTNAPANAGGD